VSRSPWAAILRPTLGPAPGPLERRAAARRCIRRSVAFGDYVTTLCAPAAISEARLVRSGPRGGIPAPR
jgi:hypothetical protein